MSPDCKASDVETRARARPAPRGTAAPSEAGINYWQVRCGPHGQDIGRAHKAPCRAPGYPYPTCLRVTQLQLERLSDHGPELNPNERTWDHLKRVEPGNLCCPDLPALAEALCHAKERLRHKRSVMQPHPTG